MPPKLTVNDYTFYFVPDEAGKYIWKDATGNVHRKLKEEFEKYWKIVQEYRGSEHIEKLLGIAQIQVSATKEYILVYEIFDDLRESVK